MIVVLTVNIIIINIDRDKNEREMIGVQARLPNTLTHSLNLSQILSLTISPQGTPKSINIIDNLTTVFI